MPSIHFEDARNGKPVYLLTDGGLTYCTLALSTPPTWSPEKEREAKVQFAEANARLLDMPTALPHPVIEAKNRGEKVSPPEYAALREKAIGLLPERFQPHAVPHFISGRSPLVRIEGPTDTFEVDINGTPLTRDGYFPYNTGEKEGSLFVRSVNLAEYCEFYETEVTAWCGKCIAPLDLEWTLCDGTVDGPEPEIRDQGVTAEAVRAGMSHEFERFGLLAKKAAERGALDIEGESLPSMIAREAEEGVVWAASARDVLREKGISTGASMSL